ncbi:MAG: AmmeMemoRadiSam system radical SAM enzyme [Patescibacteria group bacterium]
MDKNLNKIIKIIIGAAIITFLGFLPWILISNNSDKVNEITNKLTSVKEIANLKEAMYYESLANGDVRCNLCPNRCILTNGQSGLCRVRKNIDGKLYSLSYGQPVTTHIDPIEKKPLFHFLPGANAYSLATVGCNLSCQFCQNWDISQAYPEDINVPFTLPEDIVNNALKSNSEVIAFTYSEPIIFYEYMIDIAKLAHENNLKTVMISGGYINQEPLLNLLPYLDGIKIDLKAFSNDFYLKITNGQLQSVLDTIKTIHGAGKHLEIVYLIIPGENDSDNEIKAMCEWLKDNLGEDAILHFSRFYPQYKMTNKPPTPIETVKHAREIALKAGLKYVYTGNIEFPEGESTYCADGSIAIKRQGYFVLKNTLANGQCVDGTKIPGVWQ